jgi:hypothetical protein
MVEVKQIRPFATWLSEQRNGVLSSELADALNMVVGAVQEVNKEGKLTLTLTIKPAGDGMVAVQDKVALALPIPDKRPSMWFVDGDHNLSKQNPNQMTLPLREVPRDEPAELREAQPDE